MDIEIKRAMLNKAKALIGVKQYRGIYGYYSMHKLKKTIPDAYLQIKRNSELRGTEKGKRCFILGNGPSIKSIDFSKLQNEAVFSVNYFNRIERFEDAAPNFHVMIDPKIIFLRNSNGCSGYDLRCFTDLAQLKSKPVLFLPTFAFKWSVENEIDKILDVRYVYITQEMLDGEIANIDLTKGIYFCETVVQYSIQIAIYLGFKEIYLLGCESTVFFSAYDMILNGEISPEKTHAYKEDNMHNEVKKEVQSWQMHEYMYSNYKLFLGYERLMDYCNRNKIILKNCTQKSLITEIEKADFSHVLCSDITRRNRRK